MKSKSRRNRLTRQPRQEKREQTRRCIVTGAIEAPEDLVRFVLDPAGLVTPDIATRLPGRGAWVTANRDAIAVAALKGHFAKAFKASVRFPDAAKPEALAALVEKMIEDRALAALGLARRSGTVIMGFEKVRSALRKGGVGVLLSARDASPDGVAKLARLARDVPIAGAFDEVAQSRALGREGVTHAAVAEGPEAARLLRELLRLQRFRPALVRESRPETPAV